MHDHDFLYRVKFEVHAQLAVGIVVYVMRSL